MTLKKYTFFIVGRSLIFSIVATLHAIVMLHSEVNIFIE